jgi:predicted anti-sigma-YlaC factor YlaD
LDRKLTLAERWGMWLHLRICAACRRFERQMALLRQAMRRLQAQEPRALTRFVFTTT